MVEEFAFEFVATVLSVWTLLTTFSVVEALELFVTANCDYSKYRCKTNVIRFKDTLMFQTRVFE